MRPLLFRIVSGVALVVAALAMFLAFDRGRDEEPPVRRGAIVRVFPQPNTVALRQDAVGVELAFGYTGSITIDRRVIPDDQLDVVPGINRVSFTPGDGKEIEELDEGRHCATVEYRSASPDATPGAATPRDYTWCFVAA
ncbi:MAG TPA: hypothetical protein VF230_06620 [Acidimicrobiales bacterium]